MNLKEQAQAILKQNSRDGFTIPTENLYPYQWNWDSALCALGISRFDLDRAYQELLTLTRGQWSNGMIPHIIFWNPSESYFPGPEVWRRPKDIAPIPTSCITQPPMLGSVIYQLHERSQEKHQDITKELFEKTLHWHEWWIEARGNHGLVAIMHPWESGRDNSPEWDEGLENIKMDQSIERFQRRDTSLIDEAERPREKDYEKYLSIIQFGKKSGWDPAIIKKQSPFWFADIGTNCIFLRANRDLLKLAEHFNYQRAIPRISGWIQEGEKAILEMYNDRDGFFSSKDLHTSRLSHFETNASHLIFYSGALRDTKMKKRCVETLQKTLEISEYALPSLHPDCPWYEPKRYWRGPVWVIINYLILKGLMEYDFHQEAEKIKSDTLKLIEENGFYEYYHGVTGQGLGGGNFSWTAAIYLELTEG